MNIIWLGHASFRIEIEDQVLLIDPWLEGNPMLDETQHDAAVDGATHILVTHGHFDHTNGLVAVSQKTGAPVSGIVELASSLAALGAEAGHAFNKGGTIRLGDVAISMVPACHSSTMEINGKHPYMGDPVGYVIKGDGHTLYVSGDTGISADMDWIGDYFQPDVGILAAGGYYTMDMAGAAYAAKRYFNFDTVIPCHYRTFPALEQSAEALKTGLPGVKVIEPQVMEAIRV